jgi:transcriptional regulator with XRE-family HTH domain
MTRGSPDGDAATIERELIPPPASWRFTIATPWDEHDEAWLEVGLRHAQHFDDAPPAHDPVECQMRVPEGEPRREWKLLREDEGLTLRDLARLLDVDAASVSRWESGARWPNNSDYSAWLREAGERHGERARLRAFDSHSKRDGWLGPERVVGQDLPTRLAHWDVFYKEGGLFDRWVETGSLPAWTPRDAGIV